MCMLYELIDVETANVIGSYRREAEALAEVRSLLRANGETYARALSLAWEDGERDGPVAAGEELAARARAARQAKHGTVRA